MGAEGGRALLEKRGVDHMRRIASEGGHAVVARYGTGYMALIGSAGNAKRYAKYLLPRHEAAMDRSPPMTHFPDDPEKQELIEYLLNRSFISEADASRLIRLPYREVEAEYSRHFPEGVDAMLDEVEDDGGDSLWPHDDESQAPPRDEVEDDDPQCAYCGVYRSEHSLCGCPDGFVTVEGWKAEREAIEAQLRWEDGEDLSPVDYEDWGGDW